MGASLFTIIAMVKSVNMATGKSLNVATMGVVENTAAAARKSSEAATTLARTLT